MTCWKRDPSRNQESWWMPSSTVKSLKRPNFEECLSLRYCEHAYTIREKTTQLWFPKPTSTFPLDLSFDKTCPSPNLFGKFYEAVRGMGESTFSSGRYCGNAANGKNNGQRRKNSDYPTKRLEASVAWGQDMEGKLKDKINQRCCHFTMCLKRRMFPACAVSRFSPRNILWVDFSLLMQFSFKCFNSPSSIQLQLLSLHFFFFFLASGNLSILYGSNLWFSVILEAFPLTKIKQKDFKRL